MATPAETLTQAVALHQAGRLAEARRLYDEVLAAVPGQADALHLLGVLLAQTGEVAHAVALIRQAIARNSRQPDYHANLGNVLRTQGDLDGAIACYRQAVALRPAHADAWSNLGAALAAVGDATDAEHAYRQALAVAPQHGDARFNLGVLLAAQTRSEEARAAYEALVAARPNHAKAHNNLGLLYERAGTVDRALAAFAKAGAVEPGFAEAHFNHGRLLHTLGRPALAISALGRAVTANPGLAPAQALLGNLLQAEGRTEDAIAAYRAALEARPDYAEAAFTLGALLNREGSHGEALTFLDQAVRQRGDWLEGLVQRGVCLARLGRTDAARADFERALARDPDHPTANAELGHVLLDGGAADAAIRPLRRAIELGGEVPRTLLHLGAALYMGDHLEEAETTFRRLAVLAPQDPDTHHNLGKTLERMGRPTEAAACHRQALAVRPDHADALNGLGAALVDLGDFTAAADAFRACLGLDPAHAHARLNLGCLSLLQGDVAAGWPLYEARWQVPGFPSEVRRFPQPVWTGGGAPGDTVLVWGEQGLGDEVLFASLVPELTERGLVCTLECAPRLVGLLKRSLPGVTVVPRQTPCPPMLQESSLAWQCPAGTLARWLRPTPACFSGRGQAFLRPDAAQVDVLRRRYAVDDRPLVGLSWHTVNRFTGHKRRLALLALEPILRLRGLRFIVVQYDDHADEVAQARAATGADIVFDAAVDPVADPDMWAAQLACLDLIVTIDNATAHVGGALGVPTWVLLPQVPEWRWGLDGEACAWWSSLRLFRQSVRGAWGPVVMAMGDALADRFDLERPIRVAEMPAPSTPPAQEGCHDASIPVDAAPDPHHYRIDWGLHTLLRLLASYRFQSVLDIGSGRGEHSRLLRYYGKDVFSVDLNRDADYVGDFLEVAIDRRFDVVWCSHVLEHQRNVGLFLDKMIDCVDEGGVLAISLPVHPRERLIAGHITSWNAGLLSYNLVLAGLDCRDARFLQSYDLAYIVPKRRIAGGGDVGGVAASGADLNDRRQGDPLRHVASYFPFPVTQGCNAEVTEHNWGGTSYRLPAPPDRRPIRITSTFLPKEGLWIGR